MTTPAAEIDRHPEFRALVAACECRPFDDTPRLVLADWLQERGRDPEAAALRAGNPFAGWLAERVGGAVAGALVAAGWVGSLRPREHRREHGNR